MDQWGHGRSGVATVAEHVGVGEDVEDLEELRRHRVLDDEPGAGQAGLARVVILPGRLPGGTLQIGVGEHQQWPLAPQLGGEGDDVAGGGPADVTRSLRGAGERDPTHPPVRHQGRTDLLADALDDVEYTGRDARLLGEIGEDRGGQRRPLRRLQDHGVAGGQSGSDLPRRQQPGGVPRRDDHGRACRHPRDPIQCAFRRPGPALVPGGEVGVVAEVLGAPMDHPCPETLQEHRHVDALHPRQCIDLGVDEIGQPSHGLRPRLGRSGRPIGEGIHRRTHRGVSGECVATGHVGEEPVPIEGGSHLEGALGGNAFAADVVVRGDRVVEDVDSGGGHDSGRQRISSTPSPNAFPATRSR